jgi:hypothetical protein
MATAVISPQLCAKCCPDLVPSFGLPGVLQLLPLCKDRAVYTMRYIRTINEMNLCTVRVLANKIKAGVLK